jgi:16S rRNA (guanine527-N7)-methyltransferase
VLHNENVESTRIVELLQPFVGDTQLSAEAVERLQRYLDLLLRWNAHMNLTAVRGPQQIVTRHFGESLFAAHRLTFDQQPGTLADVGSGAGFPGIPIKLCAPRNHVTLIESQQKKATFLREVVRTLQLDEAEVFCGRAEEWGKTAGVVTLRAVEKFERVLPIAATLVAPGGRLCLLIGEQQFPTAQEILADSFAWSDPMMIPQSEGRVVALAARR